MDTASANVRTVDCPCCHGTLYELVQVQQRAGKRAPQMEAVWRRSDRSPVVEPDGKGDFFITCRNCHKRVHMDPEPGGLPGYSYDISQKQDCR